MKAGKNYRMAKTKLIINSKDIVPLNYLLDQTNNSWKIFDVLIDGSISEIATKKSEFKNFINQGDLTPLLEALRKKNSTLLNN
jgi:phospholipid transport system substrate-binding protein